MTAQGLVLSEGTVNRNVPSKYSPGSSLTRGQKQLGFLRAGGTPCGLQGCQTSVQPLSCILVFFGCFFFLIRTKPGTTSAALPFASSLSFPYFSSRKTQCIQKMKFPGKSFIILLFRQVHSSCFFVKEGY